MFCRIFMDESEKQKLKQHIVFFILKMSVSSMDTLIPVSGMDNIDKSTEAKCRRHVIVDTNIFKGLQ